MARASRPQPLPPPAPAYTEKSSVAGASREGTADPQAVQQALDTVLGLPAIQLGQVPMARKAPPHSDFVVFKAAGKDYCAAQLLPARQKECAEQQGLSWLKQEVLGFAIIEFENPAAPRVSEYRFVSESSLIPGSRETAGGVNTKGASLGGLTHVELTALSAIDIDGDQAEEYVVEVSHDTLTTNAEEGPNAIYQVFSHNRLLIFREDLSLEADGYVSQYWDLGAPGWSMDNHRISEVYRFVDSDIVLEWCEVEPVVEDCPAEVLCQGATERLVIRYDPATDNYPQVERDRLRAPIADVDWEDGVCSGPSE